jgi:hypothetical protein
MVLVSGAAWSENRVVGTVEATIGGIDGNWYVIASGSSPEDEKMTSMWMDRGSGIGLAMISGFESQTVTFRKRAEGAGLEPISGTVLAISFLFSRNETERTIVFPTGPSDPSTVVFQPEAGNYQNLFALEEGEMLVSKIETVDPGVFRFEGTFSGRLFPLQGDDSVEVTNGVFVIEEALLFDGE